MIERTLLVARRELGATLLTRAFIILLLSPVIALIGTVLLVFVVVIFVEDPSADDASQAEQRALQVEVYDGSHEILDGLTGRLDGVWSVHDGEGDPQDAAASLFESEATARVVLEADGVDEGRFTVYMRGPEQKVDPLTRQLLVDAVDHLVAEPRLVEAGLSPAEVREARSIDADIVLVDPPTRSLSERFEPLKPYVLPAGVLFLMFSALSMAGQGLLTSTLEEKTTRVSEVLLGAVSPTELVTGKVLGQLGISLILSLLWGLPTLGLLAVTVSFLMGPLEVFYVLAFIGIASLSWAAVMGGVGSAVNDLTEAQHILGPVFMLMMVLFIPAAAAIVNPESTTVLICSLVPPMAPPVMAARITSAVPPPHWQVWLSLLTSSGFGLFLLWAAGRVFRIGLLIRDSPPNVRTLIRWALQAR